MSFPMLNVNVANINLESSICRRLHRAHGIIEDSGSYSLGSTYGKGEIMVSGYMLLHLL